MAELTFRISTKRDDFSARGDGVHAQEGVVFVTERHDDDDRVVAAVPVSDLESIKRTDAVS